MTIWLQNNDRYDLLTRLDPASGALDECLRSELGQNGPIETNGMYSMLSGEIAAFFVWDAAVFIRIGSTSTKLTGETGVSVTGPPRSRKLSIENSTGVIVQHQYSLGSSQLPIPDDPTPFIEAEDFDFGLLLSNLASSDQRLAVLLGTD